MSFDLDNFWTYEKPKFHARSSKAYSMPVLSALENAEKLLISLSVLQRMGVKCDDLLEGTKSELATAYMRAGLAEGVKSADAVVEKYERDLNTALDAKLGNQGPRR